MVKSNTKSWLGFPFGLALMVPLLLGLLGLVPFRHPSVLKAWRLEGYAQGTSYHILYFASDSLIGKEVIDQALEKIDSEMSLYRPESQISRFNQSDAGLTIDSAFRVVIRKSLEVYRESKGIFDITVEPLVKAWGFGNGKVDRLPDSATIRQLLGCVGSNMIRLEGERLRKDQACLHIDLNGIAQGYSVDVLAGLLEKKGIRRYLVELGGEIRVRGPRPDGQGITVGIESPSGNAFDPASVRRVLEVNHGALTTSGNYRKYYQQGNRKVSHLINPKTGYSFDNELISVTVWAPDALTADGYDNVLMGLGLEKSFAFLKAHPPLEAYFIFNLPDGSVQDTATAGFYRLIKKR
ncbi:MAG: FAD:protein FMN transferase [Flavisolibacter sp.]